MKKRKLWIPIVAAVLVAAVVAGFLMVPRMMPKEEAPVFPVTMVGFTDFYSGTSESYGLVTTDKVQPLYISGTQTVTEILVYPGQNVKKGDVLFTYDTTLSDLAIERKDLANQQLEVELKTAQTELNALNKMKPIQYNPGSSSSSTTRTDYSKSPADAAKLNTVYSTKTTGKSTSSPLYFWLKTNTEVDDATIAYLFDQIEGDSSAVYVVFQSTGSDQTNAEFSVHTGIKFTKVVEPAPTDPVTPPETTDPSQPTEPSQPTTPSDPAAVDPEADDPAAATVEPAQEFILTGYTMTFFTPPSAPREDSGNVQWNDGYTSAELTAMKNEKQAQIRQLQFDIKTGKSELNIMKKEAKDGNVTATFDGVVSQILDPAVAMETGEPLMKVTGGGGYYVQGTVSELALNTIQIGQAVTINSWDTGMVYTGSVVEIGTYPVEDQGYTYNSGNTSFYPYKVFIDESADLQEGYYVSMTLQSEAQASGILYLQNAFLRTEGNRSFVFVRDANGLLEKRYLDCGVSTDGYMTPVYGGITEEDYLAFPYGKDIVEGAPTYEGTDQDLYGY